MFKPKRPFLGVWITVAGGGFEPLTSGLLRKHPERCEQKILNPYLVRRASQTLIQACPAHSDS